MALVVCALAVHAHAQPSAQPPTPPPARPPPPPAVPPQPAPTQPKHVLCFAGRPYDCASVFLLELGIRGDHDRTVTTGDVGLVIHDGLNAYGATLGLVGISDDANDDLSVLYAARYRRYLGTWGFAADVSLGYADGPALEVAIGWSDVIALTAGINRYELEGGDQDLAAGVGLRVRFRSFGAGGKRS